LVEDLWEEDELDDKVNRLSRNQEESPEEYENEDEDRFSVEYYKNFMEQEEINEEEDDFDDPEI
jgi:hypothetical protein